jgi:anaerobic carbon-monoxide dehydrogenase iron sulfur subunit
MKYLKTYPEKCTGCHTCEQVCSELYFKENNPEKSAIHILTRESSFDMQVCEQCQTCVGECPTQALTINAQGVVMLNKKLCIGCYACVAVCPTNTMFTHHSGINPFKCIACGACARKCPSQALEIVTGEAK